MKHLALGIVCACGLAAAACAGSAGPTSPSSSFTIGGGGAATSGTAVSTPMTGSAATGIVRAIAQCQGPVLQTLEGVFISSSTPIVISDNGTVAELTFTNHGRSFTLAVTYVDSDGSGGLSCGDSVTGVA
jgi:hypothetical protein